MNNYVTNFCGLSLNRNHNRTKRLEFYDIVDELIDIGKTVPESKFTEVRLFLCNLYLTTMNADSRTVFSTANIFRCVA